MRKAARHIAIGKTCHREDVPWRRRAVSGRAAGGEAAAEGGPERLRRVASSGLRGVTEAVKRVRL